MMRWNNFPEGQVAIIYDDEIYTYASLRHSFEDFKDFCSLNGIYRAVVALEGDYSPNVIAMFLALIDQECIVAPVGMATDKRKKTEFYEIAGVEIILKCGVTGGFTIRRLGTSYRPTLYDSLVQLQRPGLVVFSSGTSGRNKGIVHDFSLLQQKYLRSTHPRRTIVFLLYDHLGGLNTLFHTLASGGVAILLTDRSPATVCRLIETYKAQLLPVSPTFLNLLLVGHYSTKFDLGSLELITYGSEPMPDSVLKRLNEEFPNARLLQTYGLSETGVLKTQSLANDSLWIKIDSREAEFRVVDGLLEIKSATGMLGYLNDESPFTSDGWLRTGDRVQVDGEYLRVLGRDGDMINIGGEKVFPTEVESVLGMLDGVLDVVVSGERNVLIGTLIKATVHLSTNETPSEFHERMWRFCIKQLPRYKIPQRVEISREPLHTERFKKRRTALSSGTNALE